MKMKNSIVRQTINVQKQTTHRTDLVTKTKYGLKPVLYVSHILDLKSDNGTDSAAQEGPFLPEITKPVVARVTMDTNVNSGR